MISLTPAPVTDRKSLGTELTRLAEICHGCRRCFSLCPSFEVLFRGLDADEVDGEAEKLPKKVLNDFVDLCYECRLCVSPAQCPYVPPHRWSVDIPHVVLEARRFRMEEEGLGAREKLLTRPDALGRLSRPMAPVVNFVNTLPLARVALEKTLGIHREKHLPKFAWETFTAWYRGRGSRRPPGEPTAKVVLFPTCTVEWNRPEIGKAAVQVLERNGVEVAVEYPQCCGMPFFDVGDFESARRARAALVAAMKSWVEKGFRIVTPGPSCSLMLKKEYPWLSGDADTKAVAAASRDLCEFLMELKAEGKLDLAFPKAPASVAYHLPCHLNVQRIRFKASDLLALTGAKVTVVEKCSGHDGTWAMKVEYFEESMKVGKKLFDPLMAAKSDVVASDCALASVQIAQGTGAAVKHPVEVLRDAYGLEAEA